MRQLTFEEFLKKYVSKLSYYKSNSLKKLAEEALEQNPKLYEPLLLFACFTYDNETICKQFRNNSRLMNDYSLYFCHCKNKDEILQQLMQKNSILPEPYKNIYKAYLSVKKRYNYDNYIKIIMKNRIISLQKEKGITNYRLYTKLNVNSGNFNAFMKHNQLDKLSLCIVKNMLSYLESCSNLMDSDNTRDACSA